MTLYFQVRLISLDYKSCGNFSEYFKRTLSVYIQSSFRRLHSANEFHTKCLSRNPSTHSTDNVSSRSSTCCVSLLANSRRYREKSICEYCVQKKTRDSVSVCDIDLGSEVSSDWSLGLLNTCSDFYQFYNVNEHHSVCCKDSASHLPHLNLVYDSPGTERRQTDPFVINAETAQIKQYFHKLTLQKTKQLPVLKEMSDSLTKSNDIQNGKLTGLQCKTNRTVEFYYVDSVYHSEFMRKFHVHVPKQSSKTSVILVNLQDEAVYVMKEKLNYRNLGKYVFHLSILSLQPFIISEGVDFS